MTPSAAAGFFYCGRYCYYRLSGSGLKVYEGAVWRFETFLAHGFVPPEVCLDSEVAVAQENAMRRFKLLLL